VRLSEGVVRSSLGASENGMPGSCAAGRHRACVLVRRRYRFRICAGLRSARVCLERLRCSVLWWSSLRAGETCARARVVVAECPFGVVACSYSRAVAFCIRAGLELISGLEGPYSMSCPGCEGFAVLMEERDVCEAFGASCLCGV